MPKFIHDSTDTTTALTGTYDYRGGILEIPSGNSVADVTAVGQLMFVPASGAFMIASGSYWGTLAGVGTAVAVERAVDDASVSGALAYWFNEDSWITGQGVSGIATATGQDPLTAQTCVDRLYCYVASGSDGINGIDTYYQKDTLGCLWNDSISNPSAALYQGTDKPITTFIVARVDDNSAFSCFFTLCRHNDNNDSQRQWFVHTGGRLGYFERDDVATDFRNIGASSNDLDNKIVVGTPFLFTTATSADGKTLRAWKNNVEWTIAPSGLEVGAVNPADIGIGVNVDIGLDSVFKGMIGEIVSYGSGMTETEVTEIRQSLMTKWGI